MAFSRIFVPTDGTDVSLRALGVAAELVTRYDAELLVVTPIPVPERIARHSTERGAIEAYVEANAKRCLDEATAVLRSQDVGAELKVIVGATPEKLVTAIEESAADLVVMGRRSRDEPKDLLLGSVSDRVARHLKVPILLVP